MNIININITTKGILFVTWTVEQLDRWTMGQLDSWTVGQMDSWT